MASDRMTKRNDPMRRIAGEMLRWAPGIRVSWADLVRKYNLLQGEMWLVVTLVVALSPWLARNLRRRRRSASA